MTLPPNEPTSADAVQQWVETSNRTHDRFADVAAEYDSHRAQHGCYDVYPYPNGALLGTLAGAHGAKRIIEVGGGRATARSGLPTAPARGSKVDSIEKDPDHANIARAHFTAAGLKRAHRNLAWKGRRHSSDAQGQL